MPASRDAAGVEKLLSLAPMNIPADKPYDHVQQLEIPAEQAGQRIDNFLMARLKGVPKSHVYRILRKGEVRVNKGRIKADYRLQAGDLLRIPPVRIAEREEIRPGKGQCELLEQRILYEDPGLIALNKPSGMAVHGGSGLSFGVIEALRAARPDAPYLELVHRLDRETSGVLLIAKKRSALRALHEALRTGGMRKRYLALLAGPWRGGKRRVDAALQKNTLRGGERVVRIDVEGKQAASTFIPRRTYSDATLVEVDIETGRTHQIRVHAEHIGHPVAGDEKYGHEAFNRQMRELGLRRLFLHAYRLSFQLPEWDKPMTIEAPLPEELEQVLSRLTPLKTA